MSSPYLDQIHQTLPRLLALFDNDPASASYGIGDRFHWAWGLIDFGNGTFQGAANGLARLLVHDLLPDGYKADSILNRIDAMFIGADKLRRKDGSLEEAFPYEGSFCVTALVAYDLLTAMELLDDRLDMSRREKYLAIVRPMIDFLLETDETHAFISNHLATAVAALYKWDSLGGYGGGARARAAKILNSILAAQSEEGWYREYEGADPGYQTLCTYYLADVLRMKNDDRLRHALTQSMRFLWHFAHPDGSFGGLYGSRNTRFYYPAGIEYLSGISTEAAALAKFMRESIRRQSVVGLNTMDEPNLIPMFNAYCWAAAFEKEIELANECLPCNNPTPFRRYWPAAGLLIDRGEKHYTIVAGRKGGVVYHFYDGRPSLVDSGLLFQSDSGSLFSIQAMNDKSSIALDSDNVIIESKIKPVTRRRPEPWQFLLLRILNLTIMRYKYPRELIKKMMVRMLITGSARTFGANRRTIHLGWNLSINDEPQPAAGLKQLPVKAPFCAIHMASQGYWQAGDDK